jgi:hypothetical protein
MNRKAAFPDERLATAVARGESLRRAADECGIAYTTARRRSAAPEFKSRVRELRRESLDGVVAGLGALASDAINTLKRIMDDPDNPALALKAADLTLQHVVALGEYQNIDARLSALEGQHVGTPV